MWQKIEQKPYFFPELRHLIDAYPDILSAEYDDDEIDDDDKRQRTLTIAQLKREAVINLKDALDTKLVTVAQITKNLYNNHTTLNFIALFSNNGLKALKSNFISFEKAMQYSPSVLSDMLSEKGLAYMAEKGIDPNDAKEVQERFVPHFNKNDVSASRRL